MRKGAKKAIVAISHKLIIAVYQVLHKKEVYKSPLMDDTIYNQKQKTKSVQKHLIELSKMGFTVRLTPVN